MPKRLHFDEISAHPIQNRDRMKAKPCDNTDSAPQRSLHIRPQNLRMSDQTNPNEHIFIDIIHPPVEWKSKYSAGKRFRRWIWLLLAICAMVLIAVLFGTASGGD